MSDFSTIDLSEVRATFLVECEELLQTVETLVLDHQKGAAAPDVVEGLFRAFHTVKGSAGMFGFDHIVAFTHGIENYLDALRESKAALSDDTARTLLECRDHIDRLLEADAETARDLEATGSELLGRLGVDADTGPDPETPASTAPVANVRREIHIRPSERLFQNGLDPLSFIRHLGTLGTVTSVTVRTDDIPVLAEMQAERCYLSLLVQFEGSASDSELGDVFEFMAGDATIEIRGARAAVATESASGGREGQTVRVEAGRLDRLVDLVGELVIASAQTGRQAELSGQDGLYESSQGLARIVAEVRDVAMRLRMVPVAGLFRRAERLIHDLSRETGKAVDFEATGGETELDRGIVDRLVGPLTHILRNALDHGLEAEADRLQAGKPARGLVSLRAYHEAGEFVIEIQDDGRGFDPERIYQNAVQRGLTTATRSALGEREILDFVFSSGFSTATEITNLSGRGVGLDVVRREIEGLRGNVQIDARPPGSGSLIRIRMPLTLASIDGFLVRVGANYFVLPLDAVVECLELGDENVHRSGPGLVTIRDEALGLLDLNEIFDLSGQEHRRNIVLVQYAGRRLALLVDSLHGEVQSVIKPLNPIMKNARGLGGFTILGDGNVALILDLAELVRVLLQTQARKET